MSRRARVVLAASIVVVFVSGVAQFGFPESVVDLAFAGIWLGIPFALVVFAAAGPVSDLAVWLAFATATLSTVVIHVRGQSPDTSAADIDRFGHV